MAFKMTGFSAFTRKTGNVDPTKKLLPTEHMDTDRDIPTNRADINDRINFIKEDITNINFIFAYQYRMYWANKRLF